MRFCVIALLSLATAARAQSLPHFVREHPVAISAYLAAQGADAYATERNLSEPHSHEINPLVPSTRAGRVAYFSLTAAGVLGISYTLERRRHRKLSKWVLI